MLRKTFFTFFIWLCRIVLDCMGICYTKKSIFVSLKHKFCFYSSQSLLVWFRAPLFPAASIGKLFKCISASANDWSFIIILMILRQYAGVVVVWPILGSISCVAKRRWLLCFNVDVGESIWRLMWSRISTISQDLYMHVKLCLYKETIWTYWQTISK